MREWVLRRRRGATKVEYALMLMLISVTCMLVLAALGRNVAGIYDRANRPISDAVGAGGGPAGAVTSNEGNGGNGGKRAPSHTNNGRHGNPGQGNAGNDKSVGNAGSKP